MLPFKTFCFCCKLEMGAYVLGILGFFISLAYLILCSIVLSVAYQRHYVILVQAVFAASFLLAFALLISGINKRKKWLLLPYIVLGTIAMAINVLGVIYFVFSTNEDPRGALVVVGVSVITIPLGIHNVLSIISLFMSYKSKPTDVSKDGDY